MNLRGVLSQKQQLIIQLEQAFLKAESEQNFYILLEKKRLKLYSKNGKVRGVLLNRKFRFSTLGFTKKRLKKLDLNLSLLQREKELEEIQKQQEKKQQIEK